MEQKIGSFLYILCLILFCVLVESLFFLLLEDIVYIRANVFILVSYGLIVGIVRDIKITNQWIIPLLFMTLFFLLLWISGKRIHNKYSDSPVILFFLNLVFFTFVVSAGSRFVKLWIEPFSTMFKDMGQNLPSLTLAFVDRFHILWEFRFSTLPLSLLFAIGLFFMLTKKSTYNRKLIFQLFIFLFQSLFFTVVGFILILPMYSFATF